MSVFSALDTAVSGLTAQSVAFSNISNNISNSQTIGYKAVDTSFSDFVQASNALGGQSGTVIGSTQYDNQAGGTITSSSANGALAINGNGFFAVSEISGTSTTTQPSFSNTQYYTRAGDFSSDKNGYLVNSSKEYLDGYMVDPATGALNTSKLGPINVSGTPYVPTATGTVTMSPALAGVSNLASVTAAPTATSTQTVYDTKGAAQTLTLNWTQTGGATAATGTAAATGSTWTLNVAGTNTSPNPTATVVFNTDGTLQSISPNAGSGTSAIFNIGAVGADTTNSVKLNLGSIGSATGTTASTATGATFNAGTSTQDGTAAGTYTGFTMRTDGSVMGNYTNGQSQLIAKVPMAIFANANGLKAQDGQAYTTTVDSGAASFQFAQQNGAGTFETGATESSTASVDKDLTRLIVAQQAYGANAKVVTTAETMLQAALAMKQ